MLKNRRTSRIAAITAALIGLVGAGPISAEASMGDSIPTCETTCVLQVRSGAHTDFDRLVFDLSGGLPANILDTESEIGFYVGLDGESKPLAISGNSYLFLNLSGASTYDTSGARTYTNPDVQSFSLPSIKGVQLVPEGYNHVELALSLGAKTRHQVFTLTAPDRIVVDIYH